MGLSLGMAQRQWVSELEILGASNISISWKLIRNADSQAPSQTHCIRNSGVKQPSVF